MPKFSVVGVVKASKWLGEFEADTPEVAIELALQSDAASVSLCHHCSSECEDPQIEEAIAEEIA